LNSASTNSVPEARTGGIFSGPNTGYLAMLHGDEMVIPANNDIVKQNLQNSVFSSGSDNELMVDFFEMMNEQVEKMIDMISDVNSSQRLYSKI
jgi:thioredoxin-like negative regulator of GroEL